MTSEDLERLAALIAAEIERASGATPTARERRTWLPEPVRPAASPPPGEAPPWSGAAQSLDGVAPSPHSRVPGRRDDPGAAAASIRAAAAGQGPLRAPRGSRAERATSRQRGGTIEVPIGISNRHVHLSSEDAARLFGGAALSVRRPLSQPGQFAADQRVNVVGPKGRIDGIRVVGPARGVTQVELALSDAAVLGIAPPIANSGKLEGSLGGVTLEGTKGSVVLRAGVIVPARHLHLSVEDGRRWHLRDGDTISVRCGKGARGAILQGVLVRSGEGHATELHLDVDEARATGVQQGDVALVLDASPATAQRRTLVTERDVIALSARGEQIPARALLTPGARDRARALGLLES